jgi:hypothetical protein
MSSKSQSVGVVLQYLNRLERDHSKDFEHIHYVEMLHRQSVLEQYSDGRLSVVLDVVVRGNVNEMGGALCDGPRIAPNYFAMLIFHHQIFDDRRIQDWNEQVMLVRNVQTVKSVEAVIPSTVRLYIVDNPLKKVGDGKFYPPTIEGTSDVYLSLSNREFRVGLRSPGEEPLDCANPSVVERAPQIVDGISRDDSQTTQEVLFFWKVIFDRNPPMLWVDFNRGNITVWNREASGIEVRDVLLGPIDLEASGFEVVHLQTNDTTVGDSSILLPELVAGECFQSFASISNPGAVIRFSAGGENRAKPPSPRLRRA